VQEISVAWMAVVKPLVTCARRHLERAAIVLGKLLTVQEIFSRITMS
jgi:hypothetical protein